MGEIALCSCTVKRGKGCIFVTPRVLQSLFAGGYNINDVMFYWTRGNESVSGLDTLQLAQYTVEDHYTSVSEAIYETGKVQSLLADCTVSFAHASINHSQLCSQRQLPEAGLPFRAEKEHSVLYPGDLCPLKSAGCTLLGFLLDLAVLCSSTDMHWYGQKTCMYFLFSLTK